MNDQVSTPNQNTSIPDELNTLKARADKLGIQYHHKIGVEKLKHLINKKLEPNKSNMPLTSVNYMTDAEYKDMQFKNRRRDAARLVRVKVVCMNPAKSEWEGEIISVGSSKLGTFKKYVLFNEEYHIPHIIYQFMKSRKFSSFHTVKNHLGVKVRKAKLVNEYNIQVLPPLTKDELKELAKKQAMSGSIDRPE